MFDYLLLSLWLILAITPGLALGIAVNLLMTPVYRRVRQWSKSKLEQA